MNHAVGYSVDNAIAFHGNDEDKPSWFIAFLSAILFHAVLVGAAAWEHRDNILDLINNGEVIGNVANAPATVENFSHVLEIDLTPEPPPLEENPEFAKPEEVALEKEELVQLDHPPEESIHQEPESIPQASPPSSLASEEVIKKADPVLSSVPSPAPVMEGVKATAPQETNSLPSGFASAGVVIGNKNFPKPQYPYEAKVKRFQGTVVISITVVEGKITNAQISSSSGYGLLDTSALSWIRQRWKFPENVTQTITQPVRFELTQS